MVAFRACVSISCVVLGSAPARACTIDEYSFELPGEAASVSRRRGEEIARDHQILSRYQRESSAADLAQRIWLGEVVEARTRGNTGESMSRVRPLHSLKGELPPTERTLVDAGSATTCTDVGDGLAAVAPVRSYVVVFEGLPISRYRPRGIDSLPVSAIRTVGLLSRLTELGQTLEGK